MNKAMVIIFSLVFSISLNAQQVGDHTFDPVINNPVYPKEKGSIVLIDEAHVNFHTLEGRFQPFANVLKKDGYVVKASKDPFTEESLSRGKILVIANALNEVNLQNWKLPTPSAFTDEEIKTVVTWVKNGGSLFLIADHMPFPGSAEELAAAFGFKFYNGFCMKKESGKDIFSKKKGTLSDCGLTTGRSDNERIPFLQTFTGQAFEIPEEAEAVVTLNDEYEVLLPEEAWQFDKNTKRISANNLVQGAYMKFGKGRLVIFGEAAMFTAQTQRGQRKFGLSAPSAKHNVQFLLNTIHWLDGIIE
ncbi:DUF4350 domain-containing protein [Fulvivirgaceae bacterium BMA10]|uniref:DUF4350 domain-containing protein n=2 Tax=Splendidivirga corallicola TaxID=3051826 RepID=A0ABT8KWE8_9BACT|nr:DUF4350 domain-containing protein [Fulvivirgaceae bacterium BMA10]